MVTMATVKLLVVKCFLSTTLTTIRAADQRAATFKAMTSSTGQVLCAVDEPTEVEWLKGGSQIRCGTKCIASQGCLAYNFNKLNGKCDKYCAVPRNYTTIPGCSGYIIEPFADGDQILVQHNIDGSSFFQRTWAEYKAGFCDIKTGNYWLGNDQLHALTATGLYEMRFDLQFAQDGQWRYAEYSYFYVGDETSKYKLSYSGYIGTAPDYLAGDNGMKFSTKDSDNDNNPSYSCAAVGSQGDGAGFWYNQCGNIFINSPKTGGVGFMWRNDALGSSIVDWKLLISRMTLIRK